jgi:hypothetical protein
MDKRNQTRISRRLTCEIAWQGQRFSGIVRDVTDRGLFVQTLANPAPNSLVRLSFPADGARPNIQLEAGVARRRVAPRRLQATIPSGIGLEIMPPRAEYEKWLVNPARPALLQPSSVDPQSASHADPVVRPYRFRLVKHGQASAQLLTIRCATEAGARARALARAGNGWKIADVQAL